MKLETSITPSASYSGTGSLYNADGKVVCVPVIVSDESGSLRIIRRDGVEIATADVAAIAMPQGPTLGTAFRRLFGEDSADYAEAVAWMRKLPVRVEGVLEAWL